LLERFIVFIVIIEMDLYFLSVLLYLRNIIQLFLQLPQKQLIMHFIRTIDLLHLLDPFLILHLLLIFIRLQYSTDYTLQLDVLVV